MNKKQKQLLKDGYLPNSKCHFNTFHLAFELFTNCPDTTCDYPKTTTYTRD